MKFSIKRTPDESWAATTVQSAAAKEAENGESVPSVPNTVLNGNSTTILQQNDHVRKVLAEFGQQSSDEEATLATAAAMDDGKNNTLLSSTGSFVETTSKSSSKKSKHKSSSKSNGHHHHSKGKVIKDTDIK